MPLVVGFDILAIELVELGLFVDEELLTVGLSLLLRLFLACLLFAVLFLDGLAADDILLARADRHLEPLEELAEAWVVRLHLLLVVLFYDVFHVVDAHVGPIVVLLLAVDLVGHHGLGQLCFDQFFGLLPAELVRIRLADLLTLDLVQEEKTLQELRHLEHSECFDVLKHLLELFLFEEPLGFDLQSLLVVLDLLEHGVVSYDTLDEVLRVEIDGVHSVGHLLLLVVLGVLLLLDVHELELAVSVSRQTGDLLGLPGLLVRLDRLQSESLLVI